MRFPGLLVVILTLAAHVAAASVPCGLGGAPEPVSHSPHHAAFAASHEGHVGHGASPTGGHAGHAMAHSPEPADSRSADLKPACGCGCGEGTPLARASGKRLGPALPAAEFEPLSLERAPSLPASCPGLVSQAPLLPEPIPIAR